MAGTTLTCSSPLGAPPGFASWGISYSAKDTRHRLASCATSTNRYLLAKGDVIPPESPLSDVIDLTYTGNRLHPTQKPTEALRPLVRAFCKPRGIVLDPFCGSGSTLVAARDLDRNFIGIELDGAHHLTASRRLQDAKNIEAAA